jgi:uroporphyrinogen decarboxylase
MTGKERVKAIFDGKPIDRHAFWLGNPADDTKEIYAKALGIPVGITSGKEVQGNSILKASKIFDLDVRLHGALGSDLFWASPELDPNVYQHPDGKPMFDVLGGEPRTSLTQPGIFADCEDVDEVEAFDWPNPDFLNFDETMKIVEMASSQDMAILGGMWMPFFHTVADFFGMENYFMKMFTAPHIVKAVTDKVVNFYMEANRRCLDTMGDKIDAQFFGNDFGSQTDLLISPDQLREFVFPGIKKIIDQAKSYNLKVVVHSCGAVSSIIPDLIEFGIDGLHPLQAKAKGMDALSLATNYKDKLVFIGGVDTQELLPFGTPEQVKNEVIRLKNVFGERFVVSPSHEALLSNVRIENVLAMRAAAIENIR